MTATITDIRTYRRSDTPARWRRALARAIEQGVTVRQLATSGVWIATSGTDAAAAYVVTPTACECRAAAEGDVCCKHRAMLRHVLGMLDPEPPTPAAPAATVDAIAAPVDVECPDCDGVGCAGFDEDDDGRYWPAGRCARCDGEGVVPAPTAAAAPGSALDCGRCDGRGYHRKESPIFGTTYRVNCRACRGSGVAPARWVA